MSRSSSSRSLALASTFAFLAAFSLAGCSGTVLDGGTVSDEPVPPSGAAPTNAPPFDAATTSAAAARCGEPQGGVAKYETVEQLSKLLVGAWLACPSTGTTSNVLSRGALGYEFTHDGKFFVLVSDGNGGIVRSGKLEDTGDVFIYPPVEKEFNDVSFQIDVVFTTLGTMATRATFSGSPRQMVLQLFDYVTFVPLS